jgi:hypothetical protein
MTPGPITPQKTRQFLIILWVAMFATLPLYFFIMNTALTPDNPNPNSPLVFPMLGLAVSVLLASLYLKARFGAREGQQRSLAMVRAAYIIALVFTETAALFGIVVYAFSGWPKSWMFLLISAAGYLLNFPRRDDFDQFDAS